MSSTAFFHEGTWDRETRANPWLKWMEQYTNFFDSRDWSASPTDWYAKDTVLIQSDGSVIHGAAEVWAKLEEIYRPFTEQLHEPYYVAAREIQDGSYEMFGQAQLYANFPGSSTGEPKVKDLSGKEWDIKVPGAFKFCYAKNSHGKDGIVLTKAEIMSDKTPVMMTMLKRGLMKPSDLGL